MSLRNFLFFRRDSYALPEACIVRVANFDDELLHAQSIADVGLLPELDLTPVRVLFVHDGARQFPLIVRGQLQSRSVLPEDIIELPSAFFATSIFGALIRHSSEHLSLLLAPERLRTRPNCEPL